MRNIAVVIGLLALLSLSRVATAQMWLEDRASSAGPGFKLGDALVLHVGLGAEGGYDTNALFKAEDPYDAGRLRITPFVDLATRSSQRRVQDEGVEDATPPKVDFRLGVAGYWDQYFASEQWVKDNSDFGIDTHANVVVLPEGDFSFLADVAYLRTLQPYETAADARARQQVTPGVGFRLRPGGGTLSFQLSYRLRFMYFEDPNLGRQNNQHAHDVSFETNWKVFPKTALISKVLFSPTIYYESSSVNENSLPVRAWFGIQGLFTDRFGLKLLGGYGASNYEHGPNFDSFLAQGELMFFVTPFSQLRLGGERDFVDSFYGNYYVKNGGYLKYSQMFGGVVMATLKGEAYYRDYATFNGPLPSGAIPSTAERSDIWAGASLLLEWRATDWLTFHASGQYLADITDFYYTIPYEDPDTGATLTDTQDAGFQKFVFFGGVRGHY
jgi:hypothetical protein